MADDKEKLKKTTREELEVAKKSAEYTEDMVKSLSKIVKYEEDILKLVEEKQSIDKKATDVLKKHSVLSGLLNKNNRETLDLSKQIQKKNQEIADLKNTYGDDTNTSLLDEELKKLVDSLGVKEKHRLIIEKNLAKQKSIGEECIKELKLNQRNLDISNRNIKTEKEHLDSLREKNKLIDSYTKKLFGFSLRDYTKSSDLAKQIGLDNFVSKMNKVNVLVISALIGITMKMFEVFQKFDTVLFSLRTHFGLFRSESKFIEEEAKSTALNYAKLGVTIEMSANAIKGLGDNFGLISTRTQEITDQVSIFNASLGIAEKTSADMLLTLSSMSGKSLKDASEGMMEFTRILSAAAGTNLNQVMSDIATASDSVRSTFRGNTLELIKTTVEARRMGLSLESMAKTSESLLNFNSSVNAEMEASLLLGKNLNLNEVRRLSWAGRIGDANKEILRVVKSAGDFDKMNMFQKKALAAAFEKTVEELQKMIQRDKEIAAVRASGRQDLIDQLDEEEKLMKLREKEAKDYVKIHEERKKQESNQTRMNELQQQWNQLILDVGKPLLTGVIEPMMKLAVDILPSIIGFVKENHIMFKLMGAAAVGIAAAMGVVSAKIALILGTFVGFYKLGNMLSEYVGVAFEWIVEKWFLVCDDIIGGIVSINKDILSALTYPFEWAWKNTVGKWIGKSPSELGLGIVNGIVSVGESLINALISPFKTAYKIGTELFSNIPEFIANTFKRGFDFVSKLPGMGLLSKAIDTFSGGQKTPEPAAQKVETVNTKQDDTNRLILEKLTELTTLLRTGAIAVNLDGRKVSEALAYASSR
jgi:hypothetical protein